MSKKCRIIDKTYFSYFLLALSIALILSVTITQQKSWAPVSLNVVNPCENRTLINTITGTFTPVSLNTVVDVGNNIEVVIMRGILGTFKLECRNSQTGEKITCPQNYKIQPSPDCK